MSVQYVLNAHRYYFKILDANNLSLPPEFSLSKGECQQVMDTQGLVVIWGRWGVGRMGFGRYLVQGSMLSEKETI